MGCSVASFDVSEDSAAGVGSTTGEVTEGLGLGHSGDRRTLVADGSVDDPGFVEMTTCGSVSRTSDR